MTIADALASSTLPTLDKELLLAYVLKKSREWLIAHSDDALKEEAYAQYQKRIKERESGKPLSYITHTKEFYGRDFFVDERVLIPRPSTERLIDQTLDYLDHPETGVRQLDTEIAGLAIALKKNVHPSVIVDVGTGSGCIAITLAQELPKLRCIATDIAPGAIQVALQNAIEHEVQDRIDFVQGDGLESVEEFTEPFLIVSNPPYIPEGTVLTTDVSDFEPQEALFGGKAGVDLLLRIVKQAQSHSQCVGLILECQKDQTKPLLDLFES